MSKKKNSKKKKYNNAEIIREKIVEELIPEATEDTLDMYPVDPADPAEAPTSTEEPKAEFVETLDVTASEETEVADAPVSEAAEVAEVSDTFVPEMSDVPEVSDTAKTEVTDFTLVMDPVNPDDAISEPEADMQEETAASTAITPIIPVSGYGETNAGEHEKSKAAKLSKIKGVFDKPVTRKFLAAALGLTLILNGAIAAGIMALYSHGIRKDVDNVRETVSELENSYGNSGNPGGFGNGDRGMTPPDWNGDDSWNSGDNGYYGDNGNGFYGDDDDDYYDSWDDDDWDDDDQIGYSAPDSGDSQNQQNSSGVSIGIVISDNNGVYISQVTGSNAQKAGFQSGDKIVSFDGEDISDCNSLIAEVQKHKSGDKVKVVVERNGKEKTISTTLE